MVKAARELKQTHKGLFKRQSRSSVPSLCIEDMISQYLVMLALLPPYLVLAANSTNTTSMGCHLQIPNHVKDHLEAEGEPLQIRIIMEILQIRDVPDRGGSFGVDFR